MFNWREGRQINFRFESRNSGECKREESFRNRKSRSTKHVYSRLDRVRGRPLHNTDILAIIYVLSLSLVPVQIQLKPTYDTELQRV